MTGQEIQDRVNAIVLDLQTTGKGRTVNIMFRNTNNTPEILPLSSTAAGVVNATQLETINDFISSLKFSADNYTAESAPVTAARETFNTERSGHQALIDAASAARVTLNDALLADAGYQTAKTALDGAQADLSYIEAKTDYENQNVSENYAALAQAKGEYIP